MSTTYSGTERAPSRAELTRASLLDGARKVFVRDGWADTSIASVVDEAGASVGSLYHHFAGKADLFLALYAAWSDATGRAAGEAVAEARDAGETDAVTLFQAGTRGYLRRCREDADLTLLFLRGDGPDGFDAVRRERTGRWIRRNGRLIRADERRYGEALVTVLTTVVGTAGAEVASASDADAPALTEAMVELVGRIAAP